MLQFAFLPLQSGGEAPALDPTIILIGTVIGIIIAAIGGYWVYKDASKRENNELLWSIGIAALLFLLLPVGVVALIVYVIVRNDVTSGDPTQDGTVSSEW
ncbi:hypothetical protein HYG81_10665 [Natrinema zhouii]|uniref:Cardiolipin synthase N-terminal domain-containing protein n=1 Tax=Natrinema zhouii TaxID=1710539 RepID=A0A7D6H3J3_9EURY|nr:hypothetical protein [Natrinema zhouii]QLK24588.1 hypothetical protein HYG81_10665 [Natrinema zhouii]